MYKKLLICGLCGLLAGEFFSWAQEAQSPDTQQQRQNTRRGTPPGFGGQRPERSERGGVPGEGRGERTRMERPERGEVPPGPAPAEFVPEEDGVGLEEIEAEDDTKNPLYGNPYRIIVQRNLFSLKPALVLGGTVSNVVPMALNTNNLKFMGITTIGGIVKSHFMISKPGQQPPQQYISLTEGQASDGLECVSINPDPNDPTAEVRADGKQIKVSFETHGINAGAGVAVAANRPGQQQQQGRQDPRQQQGQRNFPGQQQQQQQASGGFNLPAVNAAAANTPQQTRSGSYSGWRPFGGQQDTGNASSGRSFPGGSRSSMPMTTEANRYQGRRSSSTSGTMATPPMPPTTR